MSINKPSIPEPVMRRKRGRIPKAHYCRRDGKWCVKIPVKRKGGWDWAVVDKEDRHLNRYRWYATATGYAKRIDAYFGSDESGRTYHDSVRMHHDVIGKPLEGMHTDHINENKLDNRRCNLRQVTFQENMNNQTKPRGHNKSGLRGVIALKSGRFNAQRRINGKSTNLGTFDTAKEAHNAYLFTFTEGWTFDKHCAIYGVKRRVNA